MRYELHFNKVALFPKLGITQRVHYVRKIPSKYWRYRASLIIDHVDKKIIKDREGTFNSYNSFMERN